VGAYLGWGVGVGGHPWGLGVGVSGLPMVRAPFHARVREVVRFTNGLGGWGFGATHGEGAHDAVMQPARPPTPYLFQEKCCVLGLQIHVVRSICRGFGATHGEGAHDVDEVLVAAVAPPELHHARRRKFIDYKTSMIRDEDPLRGSLFY